MKFLKSLAFLCLCHFEILWSVDKVSFQANCPTFSCLPVAVNYQPKLNKKPLLASLHGQRRLFYKTNLIKGQQKVALAGFSELGYPVFFTNYGLLEVLSPEVKLQCAFCLTATFNRQKTSLFLPALDLPTVRLMPESISVWPSGMQYVAFNGQCLHVQQNNLFEIASYQNCRSYRLSLSETGWRNSDLTEMIFSVESH